MNRLAIRKRSLFFAVAVPLLAGCGTVYVNPSDRSLDSAERDVFTLEQSVDAAYRKVFNRLQECVSSAGYRVHGQINRARDAADVVVDSGFGFERTLYLADSIVLKAELSRIAPQRTRITFILADADARPFADAARRWLISGAGGCRA